MPSTGLSAFGSSIFPCTMWLKTNKARKTKPFSTALFKTRAGTTPHSCSAHSAHFRAQEPPQSQGQNLVQALLGRMGKAEPQSWCHCCLILGQFSHELNLGTSFLQKAADISSSHSELSNKSQNSRYLFKSERLHSPQAQATSGFLLLFSPNV